MLVAGCGAFGVVGVGFDNAQDSQMDTTRVSTNNLKRESFVSVSYLLI